LETVGAEPVTPIFPIPVPDVPGRPWPFREPDDDEDDYDDEEPGILVRTGRNA